MTSEVVCDSKNCKLFFFEASTIFYNSTVDRVKPKQHAQRGLQFEGSCYVIVGFDKETLAGSTGNSHLAREMSI
jgi:hypothetical protein